tara:strand:+ start:1111 stop:1413 length:303 start_codon:yes stop_codon:yes gene_type:complete
MLEEQKTKSDWQQREIGAFWTRDSSKGKYLSGSIEVDELGVKKKMKVVMFPNRYKDNDKKPDYVLYVSKDSDAPSSETQATAENSSSTENKNSEIPDSLV